MMESRRTDADQERIFTELVQTSEAKLAEAFKFVHSLSTHSMDEVATFIVGTIWDARQEELLDILEEAQKKGITDPSQVSSLKRLLLMAVPDALHSVRRYGHDAAIALGSYMPANNHMDSWTDYNPNLLIREFTRGKFGHSWGLPGAGKTDLACSTIEQWLGTGHAAITNIKIAHPPHHVYYANRMSLLLKWIVKCDELKLDWLFIDDEGGTSWLRAEAMTGKNLDQSKFVRIVRKLHGNFYYIDQLEPTPSVLTAFITAKFHCIKPGEVSIALGVIDGPSGRRFKFKRWVNEFPRTTLQFDTDDPASFRIDVPMEKVHNFASEWGIDGIRRLLNMLNPEGSDEVADRRTRTRADRSDRSGSESAVVDANNVDWTL